MAKRLRVLYIDSPQANRQCVLQVLPKKHFDLVETTSPSTFETLLSQKRFDIVLAGLHIPGLEGTRIIELVRAVDAFLPVVVISDQISEDLQLAVEILKRGAADYVFRTTQHLRRLPLLLRAAWGKAEQQRHQEQAWAKLRESEDFLRDLIDNTHEAICTHDLEGRILTVNRAVVELTGYTVAEIVGRNLRDFIPPQHYPDFERYLDTIRKKGFARGLMTVITKHGERRIWEYRNTLRTTGVPQPIVRGYARDITEQRRAERALRESEERFRALAESTSAAIVVYSGDRFVYVNPATEKLTGYSSDELLSMPFWEVVHPDFRDIVRQRGLARQRGEPVPTRYEIKILRKDGQIRWIDFTAGKITWQGRPAAIGSAVDITERKQAEERLRASEARYRSLVEGSPYGIVIHQDGKIVFINPAGARLLGAERPEDLLGKPAIEFVHPDYRDTALKRFRRAMEKRETAPLMEEKFLRLDGTAIDVEVVSVPILYEGRPAIQVIFHDISQRKKAEEELRALKEFHESLVQNVTEGIITTDAQGIITFVNPALAQMLGYQPEDMIGRAWMDFVPPDQRDIALAADRRRQEGQTDRYELILQRRDGSRLTVLVSGTPRKDPLTGAFVGTLAVITDITSRKRYIRQLEAQARIAEALRETLEMDTLLERILEAAIYAIPAAEKGSVLLMEPDGRLRIRAQVGYTDPRLRGFVFPPNVGFASLAARERRPLLVDDAHASPEFRFDAGLGEIPEALNIRSAVATPLLLGDKVIGVITLDSDKISAFTEDDLLTLSGIATTAALIIERARLFTEVQRRASYLATLNAILIAGSSMLEDIQQVLHLALDHMLQALDLPAGAIWLRASSQGERQMALRRIPSEIVQHAIRFVRHAKPNLNETLVIRDCLETQAPKGADFLHRFGLRAIIVAPLISEGKRIGSIVVAAEEPREWSHHEIDFVQTVGRQLGILIERARFFQDLQRAHKELLKAYDDTIEGWAKILELRDAETEGHTRRVTELTLRLARAMGVPEEELVHIRRGALLHDIGKMAVPDAILLKPGPLNEEEMAVIRRHPQLAYEMLGHIEYLRPALDIPRYHHERWDGSGYPYGLKGEEIPLAARIFAVVDVYDALTSDRPYRRAWSKEQALAYIRQQAGKLFDPKVVQAFLQIMQEENGLQWNEPKMASR